MNGTADVATVTINSPFTVQNGKLHVATITNTGVLTLPTATTTLVGTDTSDTLTNKTLTSPRINEDVAVSTTATRLNYLTSDAAIKQYIGNLLMPVGFIYISVVATNPATVFGFGTWSAFGAGKTLVGFNASETEFDTVEETGGAKTHTLQTTEIPSHKHTYPISGVGGSAISLASGGATALFLDTTTTGGAGAHNNLQPYITTYFFKRTA